MPQACEARLLLEYTSVRGLLHTNTLLAHMLRGGGHKPRVVQQIHSTKVRQVLLSGDPLPCQI